MNKLYTPKGFVISVLGISLIVSLIMTALLFGKGQTPEVNPLQSFTSVFMICVLFLVPFQFISFSFHRILYPPPKKQSIEHLYSNRNLRVLELERFGLTEIRLEDFHNLHRFTRINLGMNELKTIDLSPLVGSTNLKELILYMNHLESIDLSPLASCPSFEYLDLTNNDLETIDLAPLSSCLKLTGLNIGANKTSHLDLGPISECKDLEVLNIDDMNLGEIDLSPLKNFTRLWFLKLNDNELKTLDITPLFECHKLSDFEVDSIELTTTLDVGIGTWPEGIRKHKKKVRVLDSV